MSEQVSSFVKMSGVKPDEVATDAMVEAAKPRCMHTDGVTRTSIKNANGTTVWYVCTTCSEPTYRAYERAGW